MSKHRNAENQSAQSYERQLRFGSMLRKLLPSGSRRWITPIVMLLLLLGIVALGSQRVALGGVILGAAGRQLYGGFLAGDEFAQSGDLRIAFLCGFAQFRQGLAD